MSRDPGAALGGLVTSWDGQSARLDEFEVVIAEAGSSDGSADRLDQLAQRRPNVTVVNAPGDLGDDELLDRALEQSTGEYVLLTRQDQLLTPRAVELVSRQARATGADLVLGRVVSSAGTGCYVLPTDLQVLTPEQVVQAWPNSCVAIRREVLVSAAAPAAPWADPTTLLPLVSTSSAVGSTAVATAVDATFDGGSHFQLDALQVHWDRGQLEFEVRADLAQAIRGEPLAWLVVSQTNGVTEIAVPASVQPRPTADREPDAHPAEIDAVVLGARLDPATADAGAELDDGIWDLRIRLASPDWEDTAALPSTSVASGVVDGRLFTLPASAGGLQLDVGATKSSVVGAVRPGDASVVESAAGALMTFHYPDLHVHGDSVVVARLRQDNFGLPARLVCHDGRGRLECFATGLAGATVITVVAGAGRPVRTGLSLDISGTGEMTLEPTTATVAPPAGPPVSHPVARPTQPQPAPAVTSPPPVSRDGAARPATQPPAPLAQRLRRRVPTSVDPVVRRLARVTPLRQAYRRLIGR